MYKKGIYPKTERIKEEIEVYVTEKLDGSNICFFKKDGELYIAQRKNIFSLTEVMSDESVRNKLYKGSYNWLVMHGRILKELLNENSAVCGEWLGMGRVKYPSSFDKRFYMFAKANIDDNFELYNIIYDHSLFIFPFVNKEIPNFIGVVPEVATLNYFPNKDLLDKLYDEYVEKVERPVEGFVVNHQNFISKYVRMKNGKIVEYSSKDRKED